MKQQLSSTISSLLFLAACTLPAVLVSCDDEPTDSKKDVDTTSPKVMWTLPSDGDLFVPRTWSIRAGFSETLDSTTVSGGTVQVDPPLVGHVRLNNDLVSYIPDSLLDSGVIYTVTLRATIRDTAGNAMGTDYQWQFATYADTIRPTVVSTLPLDGAIWVPNNSVISVAFSERMDPTAISASTFVVNPDLLGSYSTTDSVWTFTPDQNLDSNTTFTVTITTAARDRSGNALQSAFQWTFSTPFDTVRPMVVNTFPGDGDSVSIYSEIRVTFSEPVDEVSVSSSIVLSPPVIGNISYSDQIAIFHPEANLTQYQLYTVTVTETLLDLTGNALAQPYSWEFIAVPDSTPPVAAMLSPAVGACVDSSATITVSATDESGIDHVEFYVDFSHITSADDSAQPYEYEWVTTELLHGSVHNLFAVAYDRAGNSASTDTVAVIVNHGLWELLVEDNNEAIPRNLARLYCRTSPTRLSFRVETWNGWGDYKSPTEGIDVAIFLDTDQDSTTGDRRTGTGETEIIGDIGADYRIIVGNHGDSLSRWTGSAWVRVSPVDYLVISNNSDFFEVSVALARILEPESINLIAANVILNTGQWDWAPNVNLGHVTIVVDHCYSGVPPSESVREHRAIEAASAVPSPFE